MNHKILVFPLLLFLIPTSVLSQDTTAQEKPLRLFLDCDACDKSYIRQEIPLVNYVRDREDAELHLLISGQQTGSNGREYTLRFLGRKRLAGRQDTLTYDAHESDTRDEVRQGLVQTIKIGIVPFLSRLGQTENVSITYRETKESARRQNENTWDHWVFEINGKGRFMGEESRQHLNISAGASADRVTPDWKINTSYNYNYRRRTFEDLDGDGEQTTRTYTTRGQYFNGLIVRSLDDHWSAGIAANARSSTRNNIDMSMAGGPALEYNIFPYEEYAAHEISFAYHLNAGQHTYNDTTIYNKKSEFLVQHVLRSQFNFTQPWGEINSELSASAYTHDPGKNRIRLNVSLDLRIYRGLSLNLSGRYSLINDQLSIPKGNITDEEQLLNLRQQATSFSYYGSIGLKYSFGAMYNNVVNPRF